MEFSLEEVLAEIERQATAAGINPRTAKAIAVAENTGSGSMKQKTKYRGDAVSPVGASGVMQVMPATAKGLQQAGFLPADWKHDPTNLTSQVQAGIAAMKEKLGRMNNPDDLGEVAAVYNGSSKTHRAYKAGNLELLPDETRQYAEKLRRATMELGGQQGNNPSAFTAKPAGTPAANAVRTSSKAYDPAQFDTFMSDIGMAVKPGGSFDMTSMLIQQEQEQREMMSGEVISAIASKGAAAAAEAGAVASTAAAGQLRRASILSRMNLHPDAVESELTRAMDVINRTETELEPMKAEIDSRMAVGFFDNPLEWFINQTRLPGMVEQYNGIVSTQENAKNRYKTAAELTNTQLGLSANIDADLILRQGEATATRMAAVAAEEAAKVKMEGAGANIRDALTLQQLSGQRLGLQAQALQFTQQRVSEVAGETEKQKNDRAEAEQLNNINKIIVAAGGNPLQSLKGLPTKKIEQLKTNATSGKFGGDFAESFAFLYNDGNKEKVAAQGGATVVKWVQGTVGAASQANKLAGDAAGKFGRYDAKKGAVTQLENLQTAYQTQGEQDMRLASDYNPLKLDYFAAAATPELATNSLAAWINKYGPKGTEPMMSKVDEQFIVNKYAQSVATGTMTAPQAAKDITDFYKLATTKQAMLTQYTLFGMSKPEKTYAVHVSGTGDQKPVDLGNYADVENLLVKKVARDAIVKLGVQASRGGASLANPLFGSLP